MDKTTFVDAIKMRTVQIDRLIQDLQQKHAQIQHELNSSAAEIVSAQGRLQEAHSLHALANQPEPEVSEPAKDQDEPTPT